MQPDYGAEEDAPQDIRETAKGKQREADGHVRGPVPLRERDVYRVATEVRSIPGEYPGVVVQSLAGQDPSGVRPPGAFARRVWISFAIRMLMMDAMRRHPEDGTAFESERAAPGQEVLDGLERFVSAVRQQAVIPHA